MKAVQSVVAGPPESLILADVPEPMPSSTEVVIAVAVTALNFMDTLIIRDRYQIKPKRPFSPGAECAGMVAAVGSGVTGLSVGDRVCAYVGYGGAQQYVAVDANSVIRVPAGVSFEQAASVLVAHGTALHSLKDRAQLKPDETVVVTGASGGVGLAAMDIARILGARVIACAGDAEKAARLSERGVEAIIDLARDDIKATIMAKTDGKGADVVFDLTGGAHTEPFLRSMIWGGRYLVIGFASGEIPRPPLNLALVKSLSILGVDWGAWARRHQQAHRLATGWIFERISNGEIVPEISGRFPLERISDALSLIEKRQVRGKLVVAMQ